MADVHLNIAGRPYDVHCADGQEEQLRQLAALVDEKARGIPGGIEVRQLLFAALMLSDEASEARGTVEKAEPQSDSLRAAVALADRREAPARARLHAAQAREQDRKSVVYGKTVAGSVDLGRRQHTTKNT